MGTKVRELGDKGRSGDRNACAICNPKDSIPHWRVWTGEYKLNKDTVV